MKKIIFIMLITLSFQGIAQIESGVYTSNEFYKYNFENGEVISGGLIDDNTTYIHIEENAFRIYSQESDAGTTHHCVYIGETKDGYEMYGVSKGDRMEYKDGLFLLFYDFNNETLYYDSSIELHNLKYKSRKPNLNEN